MVTAADPFGTGHDHRETAMSDRWDEILGTALSRHDANARHLQQRVRSTRRILKVSGSNLDQILDVSGSNLDQILEVSRSNLGKIEEEMEVELKRSNEEIRKIISWKNDPVVYVRNYNWTNLRVYHGSLHCGWVNPRRVREMLLGEAQAVGLLPCISCGHMAVRRETQDAAA
jgi:hypothetical protein